MGEGKVGKERGSRDEEYVEALLINGRRGLLA